MRSIPAFLFAWMLLAGTSALADACPGNPDALGVEREIVVDPAEHGRIGTMQYQETLPLNDREVVLSFDDGPLPPYTTRVLQTLAAECVKATFFLVGRQARAYPQMVRRIYNEGHTVATHSQNHPFIFTRLPAMRAQQEIDQGIDSVLAALRDEHALAPFFRFPGLGRSASIEAYLASRGIMTWSADFPADDWTHISGTKVMARALQRLERKGKGVLLLHDIQPATALMLPHLLRELKKRGYHIVHVVPAGPDRPRTVTEPESWALHKPVHEGWPRVVEETPSGLPAPSLESFGWPHPFRIPPALPLAGPETGALGLKPAATPSPASSLAPSGVVTTAAAATWPISAPALSFAGVAASALAVAPALNPAERIVAPPAVLGQMVGAPGSRAKSRLRHAAPKPRTAPAAPSNRASSLKPPLVLSPPQQLARSPGPTTR